jgi:ribosomal protein S18 acetylase RimI-like enzyme
MSLELYFLRSSEAKIVQDMVKYAHKENHEIFTKHYGLNSKDLGLYALTNNTIAGAIWSREIDGKTLLCLAVLPEKRLQGVAKAMMEQYLLEAAVLYDEVFALYHADTFGFYEKFGFKLEEEKKFIVKKLQRKELIRPSDGYDPRRWMD